ncbi:MAG: redoxin domain-containing protein [Pedobacter sp.]
MELSNPEPKGEEEVHFTYIGPLAKTLVPEFRVYFFSEGPLKWITLRGKRDQAKLSGSFRLPEGTLAFCIKPDRYKDISEAYAYSVFKGGEPIAGARAGMAQFNYNFRRFIELKDSLKAIALFREEFKLNPEFKAKYRLEYFKNGSYGMGSIGKEMEAAWMDSLRAGRDEQFLFHLYSLVKDDKVVDLITKSRLREEMLRRYPKGELALSEDPRQKRSNDFSGMPLLESQYPALVALGKLDAYYGYAARNLFGSGNIVKGDHYLKKIRSAELAEGLCRFASASLVKKGIYLDTAVEYCERGIRLIDSIPMDVIYSSEQEWNDQKRYNKTVYFTRMAEIRYSQGRLDDAIAQAALAAEVESYDFGPKDRYLKYLMEAKRYQEVVEVASKYVLTNYNSDQTDTILQDAYQRQGHSAVAYKDYLQDLYHQKDLVYKPYGLELTGVEAIDFSLKDLDGRNVSLKDYRGKNVVLYFFQPYSDWDPEIERYLAKKVDSIKSAANIELLGIDESIIFGANEAKCRELRRVGAAAFFKKAGVSFPILLDIYVHKPEIYWSDRYLDVSADYGANRSGSFFLIDKNGMVRYKGSARASTSLEHFKKEFSASLKLLK